MAVKKKPARKGVRHKNPEKHRIADTANEDGKLLLRTSEAVSFKRCEQQWYWNFVDRLRPKQDGPALRFGDLIHQALAIYYKPGRKRGRKPWLSFEALYQKQLDEEMTKLAIRVPENSWYDAMELGMGMLRGYVERYKARDAEYEVVASEQTFQWPVEVTGVGVCYVVGTFDGLWRRLTKDKGLWFKEFKTTGGAIQFDALQMDEQAGRYWTYGAKWLRHEGIIKPKEDLEGILYTVLRKALPNPDYDYDEQGRKLNQDGSISKQQPGRYFDSAPVYRDRIDRENMETRVHEEFRRIAAARQGIVPVIKNPGPLFMPNCRGCGFRDMCELHETGGDWEEMRDMTMTKWDPYADHEILASERR
jgi:hypothetical protein